MPSKIADTERGAMTEQPEGPDPDESALLQRIIMPRAGDPLDVRALYMDEDKTNNKRTKSIGRVSLCVPVQSEVSFATYFNAFAASYWRRWTTLDKVDLRLGIDGDCRIDIYRSKADGTIIHVQGEVIEGKGRASLNFSLDLAPFEDGGWYWFDVTTEDTEVTILDGGWYASAPPPTSGRVAIGICTFNRPDDCVGALQAIASDPLVLQAVNAVIVADQGTRKVRDAAGFDIAHARLCDRLRIHDQDNMGGSGGFARGMYEALTTTDCDHILLMDDDIVIEPDSILRALAFSRYAEHPMLVGGQMLNLQARSHLHSMGEVVDQHIFMWRAAPHVEYDHDFAKKSLRKAKSLHRRIDVDYNGWWMCMIPRSIAQEIGLPLPLFIKWDDAEYGLRANRAGYPTASLPGVAIWHMPWSDKDDVTDWQAYFHLRNRLVVAAIHGLSPIPPGLIRANLRRTLKHLLMMEYSTVAMHNMAIDDFLAGPGRLFDLLPTALDKVRALRGEFDDGKVLPSARELPLPSMNQAVGEHFLRPPAKRLAIAKTLIQAVLHNLLPVRREHHERPQLNIPAQDSLWFLLARLDGATVGTADGRGVTFRKRDPKLLRALALASLLRHFKLAKEFGKLRNEYQQAMPELTGLEAWKRVFYG